MNRKDIPITADLDSSIAMNIDGTKPQKYLRSTLKFRSK